MNSECANTNNLIFSHYTFKIVLLVLSHLLDTVSDMPHSLIFQTHVMESAQSNKTYSPDYIEPCSIQLKI